MGRKNGQGRFAWSDGSMYEGGFVDNDINGHGVYQWGDGRKYTGQWVKNRMHGTEAQKVAKGYQRFSTSLNRCVEVV